MLAIFTTEGISFSAKSANELGIFLLLANEDEKISEQDGTVQTTIHKILSYKEANHVVAVKMDYSKIITNFDGDFVEEFLSPLKNKGASFNYVVQAPKWTANKSQGWQDSILDLGYQIITNIPPGTKPSLGVIPFKDLRHDRVTFITIIIIQFF